MTMMFGRDNFYNMDPGIEMQQDPNAIPPIPMPTIEGDPTNDRGFYEGGNYPPAGGPESEWDKYFAEEELRSRENLQIYPKFPGAIPYGKDLTPERFPGPAAPGGRTAVPEFDEATPDEIEKSLPIPDKPKPTGEVITKDRGKGAYSIIGGSGGSESREQGYSRNWKTGEWKKGGAEEADGTGTPQAAQDKRLDSLKRDIEDRTGIPLDRDNIRDAENQVYLKWSKLMPKLKAQHDADVAAMRIPPSEFKMSFSDFPEFKEDLAKAQQEMGRRVTGAQSLYDRGKGEIVKPTILKAGENEFPGGEGPRRSGNIEVKAGEITYIVKDNKLVPVQGYPPSRGSGGAGGAGGVGSDTGAENKPEAIKGRITNVKVDFANTMVTRMAAYAEQYDSIMAKNSAMVKDTKADPKLREQAAREVAKANTARAYFSALAPGGNVKDALALIESDVIPRHFASEAEAKAHKDQIDTIGKGITTPEPALPFAPKGKSSAARPAARPNEVRRMYNGKIYGYLVGKDGKIIKDSGVSYEK